MSRDVEKNQPFKLSRLNRGLAIFHCLFVTIELCFAAFYAAICTDYSLRRDLTPDAAIVLLGIASATVALGMWVTLLVSLRNLARPTLFNERCSSVLVFLCYVPAVYLSFMLLSVPVVGVFLYVGFLLVSFSTVLRLRNVGMLPPLFPEF